MRNVLWRLLMWVAEILDRNLLILPEVDKYDPPCTYRTGGQHQRDAERTRPILRDVFAARAGEPLGFVQG